jgi:hypothetical protein
MILDFTIVFLVGAIAGYVLHIAKDVLEERNEID